MPFPIKSSLSAVAILGLAACGGSGGGAVSGAASAARALNYDPVFAAVSNPTIGTAVGSTGVTGVAILVNNFEDRITFESVQMRTTNAGETLIITLNGTDYTLTESPSSPGFYTDGQLIVPLNFNNGAAFDDFGSSGITGADFGLRQGYVGVETPLEALPSGNASYVGNLTLGLIQTENQSGVDQITGTIYLNANFETGALDGAWVLGLQTTGTQQGTISGATQGNGIIGTITLAPDSGYAGEVDMIGKAFGLQGNDIAGVAGGENIIEINTGDQYIGDGIFELEQVTD